MACSRIARLRRAPRACLRAVPRTYASGALRRLRRHAMLARHSLSNAHILSLSSPAAAATAFRLKYTHTTSQSLGSGPRYQILSHVFARFASQNTHGNARIKRVLFSHFRACFDSRNMQKSVTQVIYLGPLPISRSCCARTRMPTDAIGFKSCFCECGLDIWRPEIFAAPCAPARGAAFRAPSAPAPLPILGAGQAHRLEQRPIDAAHRIEERISHNGAQRRPPVVPDDMRVPHGTTTPRHRPTNSAIGRPVERHQPVDDGRDGHDLRRSREPKPGGRHKWWRRGRHSCWRRRGRGARRAARRRGAAASFSATSAPTSPGSAPAPTAATTRRQPMCDPASAGPADQVARHAAHHG